MMRSLNISASALKSIQYALDNTGNNLANIDTVGFKSRGAAFSELLNDSMDKQPDKDNIRNSPPGLRMPSGVKIGMTKLDTSQGGVKQTDQLTDLMIEGDGYFLVNRTLNGGQEELRFTRSGAFHLGNSDNGYNLVTANGDILVDDRGIAIEFPKSDDFTIDANGNISVDGVDQSVRIPLFKISNPDQFVQAGNNEFLLGDTPVDELEAAQASIRQGALERSNVDMQKEMTNLMLVQRAYQLNARAISVTDQMMSTANTLRNR